MTKQLLKLIVATPVFVTFRAMTDPASMNLVVFFCMAFTACLVADIATAAWDRRL